MPPKPIRRAKLSVGGAVVGGFNREKLKNGEYLCRVDQVRYGPDRAGTGFHVDATVIEVLGSFTKQDGSEWPTSRVGAPAHFVVYPENVTAKGGFTKEDLIAREHGKIVKATAAMYGYPENEVDFVDDEVMDSVLAYFEKDRKPGSKSPLVGREVVFVAKPHVNKAGKDTTIYSVEPSATQPPLPKAPMAPVVGGSSAEDEPEAPPADEAEDAPPPADEVSFEDAAAAAGWKSREPKHPGWWIHTETKKQLRTEKLQALLG